MTDPIHTIRKTRVGVKLTSSRLPNSTTWIKVDLAYAQAAVGRRVDTHVQMLVRRQLREPTEQAIDQVREHLFNTVVPPLRWSTAAGTGQFVRLG